MSNPLQISSRFDLLAELGRGSQGVVYRAFDRLEQRVVALKTLAPRSPEGIFDLKTEFRSVAEVRHPNLVQLYELFADGGTAFFTMEYVDGDELPRCLYSLANDHRRINEAFGQLVAGVDALHRARRLHRDLKPSNVLLEADGRVVVLDFGLSSMLDPDSPEAHRDADLAGTFQYLAPEVMSGHPARPPADWYAIGLLLHEALLGRPAFTGTVGEVFVAKTRPFKADAGLGPFQGLVEGLLSPSPSERPTPFMLASAFGDVSVALPKVESFVGRETELGRLETARHRPGCRVVRVRGLGGVGKTTLISRSTRRLTAEGAWS